MLSDIFIVFQDSAYSEDTGANLSPTLLRFHTEPSAVELAACEAARMRRGESVVSERC